jgi:ectoine hydroxylase-related dioxygenase (phytanoyl-CoA dioxygenase family)
MDTEFTKAIQTCKEKLQLNGYFLLPELFSSDELCTITESLERLLRQKGIDSPWCSPQTANALANKQTQTEIYDELQKDNTRINVALRSKKFRQLSRALFDHPILYSKAPFRIDAPLDLTEMTLWHQDYYYVKGNTQTLTIYMPLRDLDYLSGSLSLIPESHLLGPLDHNISWGKKSYPCVAPSLKHITLSMPRGSALIFNSLLLHSTNPNYSDGINFNIQWRISEKNMEHHARMGEVLEIDHGQPNALP